MSRDRECIVIAGASQGLGKTLVGTCLKKGYSVAALARDVGRLQTLKQEFSNHGETNQLTVHSADLTDPEAVSKAFSEITRNHSYIRALINNAGTWMKRTPVVELTASEVLQSFQLNFMSAFHASKATLVLWAEQGRAPLSIINVGATASLRGSKNGSAFAIGKSSLRIFSQSLAKEMGPQGVHVAHIVVDGMIDNERTRTISPGLSDDRFMKMESLALSILSIVEQDSSCWTFEWDARPYNESW